MMKYYKFQDEKIQINKIYIIFFLIISLFKNSFCDFCPRDKPILKNNECLSIYCEQEEFDNKNCSISNPFIKTQWLNNIHIFGQKGISNICAIQNSNNGLFLIAQEFTSGDKYIFGFSQDGNGLFLNSINKTYYSFETIDFPTDKYTEIFHSVQIDKNEYLLSSQTNNEMFLIDYKKQNYYSFDFNISVLSSENIFKLNGYDDENIYFTNYISCGDEFDINECYVGLRIFKFNLKNMDILKENPDKILIHYKSKLSCFQNEDLYIGCIYNTIETINETEKYNHVISLFNHKTLKMEYNEILEENFNIDRIFDNTIYLNKNIFVTGYSYSDKKDIIKILIKKIKSNSENNDIILENYLPNIPYININEDGNYLLQKGLGLAKKNFMTKISNTKFTILLKEFSGSANYNIFNKNIIIIIFNIFNDSNISIRHYKIDFTLYDLIIIEDLRGYNLNNFFGLLLETAVDTNSYVAKAAFVT